MVNKNYQRGRAKEYRLKNKYQKEGCIVLRTSGSHGFADLVVIDVKNKKIRFVQAKPKKFSKSQAQRLYEAHSYMNDEYLCSFEVK